MKYRPLAVLVTLALLGASVFPTVALAQAITKDADGTVNFDTTHSGASQTFHLDAGDYYFNWWASPNFEEPLPQNYYCGIRLDVVTDAGRRGGDVLVNQMIHNDGGAYVIPLNGLPAGRYTFNVFGCNDLSSSISPY